MSVCNWKKANICLPLTYVWQQLVGRHAAHYDQVAQYDLEIVWPELAECAPQFLNVTWMRIRKLKIFNNGLLIN